MLGVSANTITNWKRGGEISVENRRAIDRLIADYAASVKLPDLRNAGPYPVLSLAAAATVNTAIYPIADYAAANAEDYQYFRRGRPGDFVLDVAGESMLPHYPAGTRLLCRPNTRPGNGQRVVAILKNSEIVFKIYAETEDEFFLRSLNDSGASYAFSKLNFDAVRAIYIVIESVRDEQTLDSKAY